MSVKTQKPSLKGTAHGRSHPPAPAPPPPRKISRGWIWAAGFGVALVASLIAYWPALHGEFLFDDAHMQFAEAHADTLTLRDWLGSVRPLVGFSYWMNYHLNGVNTFGYHLVNIFLHTFAALMVFSIVRKILEVASKGSLTTDARRRTLVAGFCGAIFLLHPVQTEAVAYVSQRSEELSVTLAFGAWACFLYRPNRDIRIPTVLAVLLLFGASVAGKEHVAVLPLVILLTDYYWNPGFTFEGVRRNWRLYGTFLIASLAVAAFFYSYLANEPTIGFHMKEFTWYQYLFTQCRVLFLYLRLFVLPIGQSADYAIQLSHTPFEHGAIFGMIALACLAVAAVVWRKRYPLASYGFFVALIFFLPTSSIMPVRDLAVERRIYLPMIGLLLITAEILLRIRWNDRRLAALLAALVLLAGILTWNRSFVWSSSLALWSDTAEKSPEKPRAHHGLATADFSAHRYADAVWQYSLVKCADYNCDGIFYSNWALALDFAGRLDEAKKMGRKAIELSPGAATYAPEAKFLAEDGEIAQALQLLDTAEKYNPAYQPTYIYLGDILGQTGHREQACAAFQKAWSLDPKDPSVYKGLAVYACSAPR
jgi:tetratricopeptide (TPR) repeat protein